MVDDTMTRLVVIELLRHIELLNVVQNKGNDWKGIVCLRLLE